MSNPACRWNDSSKCPAHGVLGPADPPCCDVLINHRSALRREDRGTYPCAPGPGLEWHAIEGAAAVFVNGRGLVAKTFHTLHPHGPGEMVEGSPDVFVGDGADSSIEDTRADAIFLVDQALAAIDGWTGEDRAKFREWFGDDSDASREEIRQKLLKMRERLATVEVKASKDDYYGAVATRDSSKMKVGQEFWKASRFGEDSRAGTFVHESSHYHDTAGTADRVYGRPSARALAISNPAGARSNADNVEYFCETQERP